MVAPAYYGEAAGGGGNEAFFLFPFTFQSFPTNLDVLPCKHHVRDYSVKVRHWMWEIPIMHSQNLRYRLHNLLGLKLLREAGLCHSRHIRLLEL